MPIWKKIERLLLLFVVVWLSDLSYKNYDKNQAIAMTTYILGVKIRNMKMVFNTSGTWRRVTFEKLSRLGTPYNIV